MKGKIKWFNVQKRFGYVTAEDGNEYFVHVKGIKKGRRYTGFDENDEVEFEIKEGKKGPNAVDVELVESDTEAES